MSRAIAAAAVLVIAVLSGGCASRGGRETGTLRPTTDSAVADTGVTGERQPTLSTAAPRSASIRPTIVQRLIPFPAERRREMRAYSKRHYGQATAALKRPSVIVLHYTVTPTFSATYEVLARDVADPELQELPGLCAHFVIGRDGTIYQLVPLGLRCRHTVGLNWTAIGIEHVGMSDDDVLGRAAVRRASLRLVRWLRCRFGIARSDVIGHAESLDSPYHRERVAALRRQTHADMSGASMDDYRDLLRACP